MVRDRILVFGGDSPSAEPSVETCLAALSGAFPDHEVVHRPDPSGTEPLEEVACVVLLVPLAEGGTRLARNVRERSPRTPVAYVGGADSESVPAGALGAVTDCCFFEEASRPAEALVETVAGAIDGARDAAPPDDDGRSLLRDLPDGTFDGVALFDAAGTVLDANARAAEILGRERESLVGHSLSDLVARGVLDESTREWIADETTAGPRSKTTGSNGEEGRDTFQFEVHPEGTDERVCEARVVERPGDGRHHVAVAFRDVTDRVDCERRLERIEQRYRRLVEQEIFGIYIIQDGLVRYANPKAASIFGYEPEEMIDRMTAFDVVAEEDHQRLEENIRKRERGDHSELRYELSGVRKDGSRLTFEVHSAVIEYEGDPALLGAIIDVTDRKQRQQRLTVLDRILRHNLRNDLNVVVGHMEDVAAELRAGRTPDPDPLETGIDTAGDLVEMSRKVVRIQEALERDRDGTVVVDAAEAVERVVEEYAPAYPGATIRTDLPDRALVEAGPGLEFVVENLVENALEHGEDPTVTIAIEDREYDRGEWYRIEVADDGPGIPEQERLVVENDEELTPLRHGSGVGLWGVVWIVQSYDGTVDIQSSEDGSVVTVDLRRATLDDEVTGEDRSGDAGV